MFPILFQIGPITVYSFGALVALAVLTAASVVYFELKRRGYNPELASTLIVAAALGGLAGARILFIIENWQNFLRSPWDFIFTGAGFTWYGGFLGALAAVSWILKKSQIPWLVGADISAPAAAISYGVGRLGCHAAGDGDWGTVTDVPWGVAYTNAIIGWVHPITRVPYPPGVRVHPTPIYEFLESLLVFGILWMLRTKKLPSGTIASLYLVLAGFSRWMVEFWRVNPPVAWGLSEAQWFSVVLMLIGSAMLAVIQQQKARTKPEDDRVTTLR